MLLMTLIGLLWWVAGACCFIHWWTKDYDLMMSDWYKILIAGTLGPLAYLVGAAIHGKNRILFPKKD